MAKQISSKNVIGRDRKISEIWKKLEDDSIIFTAERRIGKTTVLKKMADEPKSDNIVLYSDLEKVDSPSRFVEVIVNDLSRYLSKTQKTFNFIEKLGKFIGTTEIGGIIKLPTIEGRGWQTILEKTFDVVSENQAQEQLVFLWDEIPYMLQKIHENEKKQGGSKNSALAILDTLRAMREEHQNLRMIFTGSVGLHHVLSVLREDKYASQPINDMAKVSIGPLSEEYAEELAHILIENEKIICIDEKAVVSTLIRLTDAVPFYMCRIVSELALHDSVIGVDEVEFQVKRHLVADNDPWEMEHFRDRINIYYDGQVMSTDNAKLSRPELAKLLLHHLALSESPQTIDDCFAFLKANFRIEQRSIVTELLKLLQNDHYLERNTEGKYVFRFPLVKQWWLLAEGLK